jgi:hypothetical protein
VTVASSVDCLCSTTLDCFHLLLFRCISFAARTASWLAVFPSAPVRYVILFTPVFVIKPISRVGASSFFQPGCIVFIYPGVTAVPLSLRGFHHNGGCASQAAVVLSSRRIYSATK